MLTTDDLQSLRGVTIVDAEVRRYEGGELLRLRLTTGAILAISPDGDGWNIADETSIP